jgi:hypothetical protein
MSTANSLTEVPQEKAALVSRLKEVVEKTPMAGRHSYFQLKYFIVGKEPTVQAKLWQCLREMKARKESLEGIELEMAETLDKIELLKISQEREEKPKTFSSDLPTDDLSVKEREIKARQCQRKMTLMEKTLAELDSRRRDTEEEAAFFLQAFEDLEKVEKLKPYDDADVQNEYWSRRFSNEMNMKLMMENRIDAELAKAILSMPDVSPVKKELVSILSHQQQMIESQKQQQLKKLENKGLTEERG